jgi:hypothetical protein
MAYDKRPAKQAVLSYTTMGTGDTGKYGDSERASERERSLVYLYPFEIISRVVNL